MRILFTLFAATLLLLSGCDSSTNTSRNSVKDGAHTVARPSYSDSSTAVPTEAGTGNAPALNSSTPVGGSSQVAPASTDKPGTVGPSGAEPDNTAVNERDRNRATKTPIDQDENQRDVNITADIRKAVLAEKDMSINARNVKIVTSQGKVTLRGPVNSDEEAKVINEIARRVAGKDNVTNEIEVKAQK